MRMGRRGDVIAALMMTAVLAGRPDATHAAQQRRPFDIAARPAPEAVAEFARQAGVNVLAPGEQLARVTLGEVRGSLTVTEALALLLAGSGFTGRIMPGGAILVERIPASAPALIVPPRAQATPPAAVAPAPQDPLPVVLVPGFRASVNQAQAMKREADGIVDAVVAEDVAKFPDANLAESLQRLPGVALIRGEGGEGRRITVRGLNPSYTRVRINGIEAAAATGASDINGSTNRGRAFDFSVFASELFRGMAVHKTSAADREEGSLGATIDLRTARPFDFAGRTASIDVQENWNTVAGRVQPRVAGLYSRRWQTGLGKFGVLVSGAWAKRRLREEGYEAAEILPASGDGGFCSPAGAALQTPGNDAVKGIDGDNCGFGVPRTSMPGAYDAVMGRKDDYGGTVADPLPGSGAFHPRLPRYRRSQTDYERTGVTGTLQWRPRAGTEFTLDLMLGRFLNERTDQYISAVSFGRSLGFNGKPQASITDAHFNANGSWDYGRFDGVDVRSEALLDVYTTTFRQHVLTGSHRVDGSLKFDVVLGEATSDLHEPVRTTISFDAPNVNGFSWDFRGNRKMPTMAFGIDVADPAAFSFGPQDADGTLHGQFTDRYLRTRNALKTAGLSAGWQFAERVGLKAGVSRRRNTWTNFEVVSGGAGVALPAGVAVADVTRLVTGFGRGLGVAGLPSSWIAVDLDKFRRAVDIDCHCDAVPGSQWQYLTQAARQVDERIDAAYGRFDFAFDVAGMALRGNAGLRAAGTAVTATALNNADGTLVPTVVEKRYRDWLPALTLAAQLRKDLLLRYSAGRTMVRPEYLDLAPTAVVSTTTQTVAVGNARLDPVRARTWDLQAEWYYAPGALVSLGWFHKDINTFVQTMADRVPWWTLRLPDSLLTVNSCSISGGTPACPTLPTSSVVVSRKVNTPGGPLNGLEFNLQAPFTFLPGAWKNVGLLANYTRVKSDITYITRVDNPATPTDEQRTQVANFTGLSPRTHNLTLYYEDARIGARVSAAHRSAYLLAVNGDISGHDYTFADGSTDIDVSVSYQLTPNLRIRLEGQNLRDQPVRYGRDSQRNDTLLYVHSGRSFAAGMSYAF